MDEKQGNFEEQVRGELHKAGWLINDYYTKKLVTRYTF